MKNFNIARYILSIITPIAVCVSYGWVWFVVVSFVLLYINNVVDDVVFYYGSCFAKGERTKGVIISPVEGVVTKIEEDVTLYSHLYKNDVLTKEELVGSAIKNQGTGYLHVTIFLNKFNKHAVANMFGLESTITSYDKDGELIEMVDSDKLIADNEGKYLENTFVDISYKNGTHVVLTMDKYVSKAVLANNNVDAELLICKGSQCDLYIPKEIVVGKAKIAVNDSINLLGEICECTNDAVVHFDSYYFKQTILECIKKSGFNVSNAFRENLIKTLSTVMYNKCYLVLQLFMFILAPSMFACLFGAYIYAFCVVRFYKNCLYNLMNYVGYKEWMTITYNKLNKVLNYGK